MSRRAGFGPRAAGCRPLCYNLMLVLMIAKEEWQYGT